jgi:hypothetical protein
VAGIESKSLDSPDEVRRPEKSEVEVVTVGGAQVGRFTFQPGWRWSECVKPVVGTESCQMEHLGVVLSGRLHVAHDDGSALELGPGDAYRIAPGHDGWVVGDEPFVGLEFSSADAFAKG